MIVDVFARADIVRIATERSRGGEAVTPLWAVVVDGVPYIRSAYGPGSLWYRRAQRTKRATLIDADQRYPVAIENVDDEDVIDAVDRAYAAKYAAHGQALRDLLSPDVRRLTMRLTPA
jgi:hypothetical protein